MPMPLSKAIKELQRSLRRRSRLAHVILEDGLHLYELREVGGGLHLTLSACVMSMFPTGFGDYPNMWIAKGKHAGYATQSACNSGGVFGADACPDNVSDSRIQVLSTRNLGTRSTPLKDCVLSVTPSTRHGQECFWTGDKFRGWYTTDEAEGVKPYGEILLAFGWFNYSME